MGKTIVGVDISSTEIRAAELDGALKDRPALVRYHAVALPPGAVHRGEVLEPKTVATAFKRLWSTGKFSTRDIVLGVGNARVLARELTVPRMPIDSIRESLPFHVQEMLPFPTKDALLDFYPISESTDANGPVVNGLLVATLKSVVVANVGAATLAGLNPVNVDLVPFALSRVLQRGARSAGTVAIVDVGANTSTVVVTVNGVPQFVRIIANGGDDLTNALVTRLGMPAESAEQSKRAMGLSGQNAGPGIVDAASITFDVTSHLIGSLRDTLSYYASTRPGDLIDRIILSGRGASLRGFREALSDYTRLSVVMGDPLDSVTIARGADRSLQAVGPNASLSVAIGLAMDNAA